ncbi:unnamed protein product [Ceutorhynchus assimilis]|uniref:PPM-type phosphatase domain-containing protein n=1 Tax=Ceutorhynchus assimilis TaxID=467358 RepID=A0A9N9MW91_9CUCU|nr:unnamed protein product [Ceutorhynchus assimilis]
MPASIGVNLRVTGNCRQGGRKYMEDCFSVAYQQTEDEKDLEYAFFGIYDGHGGVEAASFAKQHLMEIIIKHKNFWSDDDQDVLRAIRDGFIATHYAMWRDQPKWPRTNSGLPSTAGTTASVAFIRRGKIYIGHVGDSGVVLGYQEPGNADWKAKPLTKDHKPESPEEIKRIESCGGKVVAKSGVPRVVWNRPRVGHQGPVRRSTLIDEIPFLAVARSLGDLWSYNSQMNEFIVSPDPDCSVVEIDPNVHRCLIFGTDGLFNMLSASNAVYIVQQVEKHNEHEAMSDDHNKTWLNPSKLLVERALDRWNATKMRADNTSAVTLMLDPPGPPRAQVLKDRKKNLPESGLKIMTRYDGNNYLSQESCSSSRQEQNVSDLNETITSSPEAKPQKNKKEENCASENTSNINSMSHGTVSYYPLKERNFVKLESTSSDSREPHRLSEAGKENNTSTSSVKTEVKTEDLAIQINEISSSNIEESFSEENVKVESVNIKKAPKRKLKIEGDQQRKSLRLSSLKEETKRQPAPCTLAEEKLRRLAAEADRVKMEKVKSEYNYNNNNNNQASDDGEPSIAQRIINNNKNSSKNKVSSQLNNKKLKKVLKTVLTRIDPLASVKNLAKSLKIQEKEGQIKLAKVNNPESRRSTRSNPQSAKIKEEPEKIKEKPDKSNEIPVKTNKRPIKTNEKPDKTNRKSIVKSENAKTTKKVVKNKKVITGKLSSFKRQTIETASQSPINKGVAAKILPKTTEKVLNPFRTAKIPLNNAVKKVVKTSEDPKKNSESQVLRETRSTQGETALLRRSGRISGSSNTSEAKENIRDVTTMNGSKSSSSKSEPPKKQPTEQKSSLKQRIQDQTKSLRKTALKKSR